MPKLPSAREIVAPFPIVRVYPAKDKVPDVSVSVPLTVVLAPSVTVWPESFMMRLESTVAVTGIS